MESNKIAKAFEFDAFVSYTTDPDYRLSQRVESFLETFHNLPVPSDMDIGKLLVCRDGSDFSIQNIQQSANADKTSVIEAMLAQYLAQSKYLIVLCSANTPNSQYVDYEVQWFLENRSADHVLLAVTEGVDPGKNPEEIFPSAAIKANVHSRPYYDLRGFHPRKARGAAKVRDPEEELANIAAHLHGDTSGRLLPLWQREALRRVRKQRWIFASVSVALLLFLAVAVWQRNVAVRSQQETQKALTVARSRSLVLVAEANIERDPELSLRLAVEAAQMTWDSQRVMLPAAASLLRRVLLANPWRIGVNAAVETFAWNPDGRFLAAGAQDGSVVVIPASRNERARTLDGQNWIESVDWTADGTLLAAGNRNGDVFIWDVHQGMLVNQIKVNNAVQSVDWRASTRQLAVGLAIGPSSRIEIYDCTSTARKLFDVPGIRASWSPNGNWLASGGIDGTLWLFKSNGERLAKMPGHSRYVHSVRWNNTGDRIATASVDDKVIVWSFEEQRRLKTLDAQFALSSAWSPDGKHLASGTGSDFIKIWETVNFEPVFQIGAATTITGRSFAGPQGYILEVAWSPDGKMFAASDRGGFGSRSGSLLLFPSSLFAADQPEELLAVARELAPRELTDAERRKFLSGRE